MRIVPFSEERRTELFALLRACLGEKDTVKRDERFWEWKHERNPFGPSLLLFGEEDGQLAGLRAFLRWQWQADGSLFEAVRAVDTATHPAHQRKGIFSRLTLAGLDAANREGVAFVFNTPNRNSLPGYLKMGWQFVARLPMQIKVLRPWSFAAGLLRAKCFGAKRATFAGEAGFSGVAPQSVGDLLNEGEGIDALLARDSALRGAAFTTARSRSFLRWRYAEHPYVPYYAETLRQGDQLAGLLIWRVNTRFGLREVMLCDLLLGEDDPAVAKLLIDRLRRRVCADYLIAHFGAASAHRRALRRCGFLDIPGQGVDFTVRLLDRPVTPDPLRAANWSLCLGDLEIF
jgi:GNAT superfamily N-acetyltransferase